MVFAAAKAILGDWLLPAGGTDPLLGLTSVSNEEFENKWLHAGIELRRVDPQNTRR